ncbi:hypothetical protein [Actinomadura vinacea]|uniref:hypothetical protein n=1 Tax=Actinomadura vinacea TaxID=115336 RepID=UPI0031CE95AA
MYCSTCGDEREFEQPPCRDGHGADCPERACTACGSAVLVEPPTPGPARSASPRGTGPGGSDGPRTPASDLPGRGRAAAQRAVA